MIMIMIMIMIVILIIKMIFSDSDCLIYIDTLALLVQLNPLFVMHSKFSLINDLSMWRRKTENA